MLRQSMAVFGLLVLSACGEDRALDPQVAQTSRSEVADEFVLAPGEFTVVDGLDLIVIFHGVLDDSRCDPTVICAWMGDASVNVGIAPSDGGDERTAMLHTHPDWPDTTSLGSSHLLRLIELQPESAAAQQDLYRARFRVERR